MTSVDYIILTILMIGNVNIAMRTEVKSLRIMNTIAAIMCAMSLCLHFIGGIE